MSTNAQPVPTIYTPPNWNELKALYSITFKSTTTSKVDDEGNIVMNVTNSGNGYDPSTGLTMFVFDGIKRAQHGLFANATRIPLQTGYNSSDHIIIQPYSVTLEVGMSDAIAAYSSGPGVNMWGNNPSKSVAAFQQMETLMLNRQIFTLNTRLKSYPNCAIVGIEPEETFKTYFGGLSMRLSIQQLFLNDVAIQEDSARVQTTGDTQRGNVQPETPDTTTVEQHTINQVTIPTVSNPFTPGSNVPGAGQFTSILNWNISF